MVGGCGQRSAAPKSALFQSRGWSRVHPSFRSTKRQKSPVYSRTVLPAVEEGTTDFWPEGGADEKGTSGRRRGEICTQMTR